MGMEASVESVEMLIMLLSRNMRLLEEGLIQ